MVNDLALYQGGLACPLWGGYYAIDWTTGQVEVRGNPTRQIFEGAWNSLSRLQELFPRIMGNLLAHAASRWGETYTEELMEASGKKYFTLAGYKSTYSRIPPENQRPTVNHSALRIVAQLPPEQQPAILDRIEAGEFDKPLPDKPALDKEARIRLAVHEITGERPAPPPRPMPCPICGGNGWSREALHRIECPHTGCGMHGDEVLERFAILLNAVRRFTLYGELDGIIDFARPYKNGWQEEANDGR